MYLKLNETAGTLATNLGSLGANGNGTYNGPTLANTPGPDRLNSAPHFDGSNDNCVINAAVLASLDPGLMTFSVFAKMITTEWDAALNSIAICISTSLNAYFGISKVTGARQLIVRPGGTAVAQYSLNWLHLAAVYDSESTGSTVLYINGVSQDVIEYAGLGGTLANAIVGGATLTNGSFFRGWLAHAAMWNRPLTEAEVLSIYQASGV